MIRYPDRKGYVRVVPYYRSTVDRGVHDGSDMVVMGWEN